MRYLSQAAASYVGVDLHARTLYRCVLDAAGTVRLARNLLAKPEPFLATDAAGGANDRRLPRLPSRHERDAPFGGTSQPL